MLALDEQIAHEGSNHVTQICASDWLILRTLMIPQSIIHYLILTELTQLINNPRFFSFPNRNLLPCLEYFISFLQIGMQVISTVSKFPPYASCLTP